MKMYKIGRPNSPKTKKNSSLKSCDCLPRVMLMGENYHELLIPKFKNNEVRNMLSSFAGREAVHQRAYALLNDTLGLPDEEYHRFLEYKEMADTTSYTTTQTGLALALAQSVFNEGMSLFSSFVMLLNFQRFGKMKGMGTIVEWSIRDESLCTYKATQSCSVHSAKSIPVSSTMNSRVRYILWQKMQ